MTARVARDLLARAAERHPHAVAVRDSEQALTWRELADGATATARALAGAGVRRGDRVLVSMENAATSVTALFGVFAAGGVAVPVHPAVRGPKLAYVISDCTPSAVLAGDGTSEALAAAGAMADRTAPVLAVDGPAGTGPTPKAPSSNLLDEDLALIIYTSGTTGTPKGVMLTHRTVCNNAWAISSYLGGGAGDAVGLVLPLAFSYGLFQMLTAVHDGSTIVLERSFAYPAETICRLAGARVTGLPLSPSIIAILIDVLPELDVHLGALRYVTTAAAPLPPAHALRLLELLPGVRLFSMYGQTECTRISYLDPALVTTRPESVGRAMPNTEVAVVDQDGKPAPTGTDGELVVRGANLMRGYWNRPVETAAAIAVDPVTGDRQLRTGDIFAMDAEGMLTFRGRKDDIFKCRGEKVAPREVESAICELPSVAEAAVVGVPHPRDGHAVKALVVPRDGAVVDPATVRAHCRRSLEPHLVPRFVAIVADLPHTASGKVERAALAERS